MVLLPKRSCLGPFAARLAVKRSENLQGIPFCRSRSRSTEADKSLPLSSGQPLQPLQQQQLAMSGHCRQCARTAAAPARAPRTGAPQPQPHRRYPDTRAAPTCTDCTTPASCPRSSCCFPAPAGAARRDPSQVPPTLPSLAKRFGAKTRPSAPRPPRRPTRPSHLSRRRARVATLVRRALRPSP